ncbi:MAG TPA: hypothetical protein VJW94_02410 [Candidatus Acidoferrum sp.]|nr:hypothetical protein [Candidatus Acidoferrum sp.]
MKQKQQIIVLVVLVAVAALVWSFEWRQQTPSVQTESFIEGYKPLGEDNPRIRWEELKRAQETEYKSNGRNPFSMIAPPTPQEVQAANDKKKNELPPVPPTPPPPRTIADFPPNLKFFGYGRVPVGTPVRAFITDGEAIFIVSEGDTLMGRYRILKIGNSSIEFQEISSGLHGTTPLEEQVIPPSA